VSWFNIDDRMWHHPKFIDLSPHAGWLWTRAGSWCASHLTDGHIPTNAVRMLGGTPKAANELVTAGLWHQTDTGYQFHDWCQWNASAAEVHAKIEATRARKAAWRERQRNASGTRPVPRSGTREETPSNPIHSNSNPNPPTPQPPPLAEVLAETRRIGATP
jgi:hypothetical protein